ncbi:MAG TPA: ankyrin repeat domain-containing protein, partial [Abditibacteriaceae bacterium]
KKHLVIPAAVAACCLLNGHVAFLQAQPPVIETEPKKKPPFPDLMFADHPLLNSIARGDTGALKALLENDTTQINAPHKSGYTPLSAAARTGNKELVQILLDKGAENKPTGSREGGYPAFGNPLAMAVASGSVEVVQLLMDKGADLEAPANASLLNTAVQNSSRAVIEFLLQKGFNIEGNRNSGYTPLLTAIQNNLPEMVSFLIEKGAKLNPNLTERANYYSGYGSPLYVAVQYNSKPIVELLMTKGADPFLSMRNEGPTPLSYALSAGRRDMVEIMLSGKININQKDRKGQTLLHQVVAGDGTLTDLVLDKGADVNVRNVAGQTPLHVAAQSGTAAAIKKLIERKGDLKAKTPIGDTPLHLALARPESATALLEAGATADIRNARGDLPLHVLLRDSPSPKLPARARESDLKLRLALVEKSDINAKDQFGLTPLQQALITRQPEVRDAILARKPNMDNTTLLFAAAARNDVAELKKLLAEKPYLNFMRLPDGLTPLHVAAQWGARDAVDYLLKKGADINARDAMASTPLLRVLSPATGPAETEVESIVTFLLEKGADPSVLNEEDEGALHAVVRRGDKKLVATLLGKGANPNARNGSNQSPFDLLLPDSTATPRRPRNTAGNTSATLAPDKAVTRDIAALLLEKGADLSQPDTLGNTPLMRVAMARDADMLSLLLAKGADANAQNTQGETALLRLATYSSYSAIAKEYLAAAKVLLDKGADPNLPSQYGETALMRALGNSNKDLAALLIEKGADLSATRPGVDPIIFRLISLGDPVVLALAIEKKVDLSVKDSSGNTPLIRAVMNANKEMVAALLEGGADPNAKSSTGQTALDLVRGGNNEIAELLKAKGGKAGKQ